MDWDEDHGYELCEDWVEDEPVPPIDRDLEEAFSNHLQPPDRKQRRRSKFRLPDWTKD